MAQQTYREYMRSNPPTWELTALDWYYEQTVVLGKTNYYELLEHAKHIEKEQIKTAFFEGTCDWRKPYLENMQKAEKYYNLTYSK